MDLWEKRWMNLMNLMFVYSQCQYNHFLFKNYLIIEIYYLIIVHGPKCIFYNISNYAIWKSLINPNTTQINISSKSIFRTFQKFVFIWGNVYFPYNCIDYTSRAFL